MHPAFAASRPRRRPKPWAKVPAWVLIMLCCIAGWITAAMLTGALQQGPDAQGFEFAWRRQLGQRSCSNLLADGGVVLKVGAHGRAAAHQTLARQRLYSNMEQSLLAGGLDLTAASTQGMSVTDLFRLQAGKVIPILHKMEVPVRAVVMPLTDANIARSLRHSLRRHMLPLLADDGVWVQNPSMLHTTLYHASTHLSPVRASTARVSAEVTAVAGVARGACGIRIVLDRVLVTRSGTVLACWQVAGGTEPAELRRRLEAALPDASKQQVVTDWSILHMTLARIVAPPTNLELTSPRGMSGALRQAAAAMTQELCGMSATLDEMWFVEEQDKLALALNGHMTKRSLPLRCDKAAPGQHTQQQWDPKYQTRYIA